MSRFSLQYLWARALKKLRGASIKGSTVHPSSKIESGSSFYDSQMGRHSFCGYDCDISFAEIGAFCSIASKVVVGGGAHPVEWISTSPVFYDNRDSVKQKYARHSRPPRRRVVIGNDVWVGANAIVMQGVSIGTGAVVGAGSVVTRDVPPYAIVAGAPARILRMRFEDAMVEQLLQSKWWELDDERLDAAAPFAQTPSLFLDCLSR